MHIHTPFKVCIFFSHVLALFSAGISWKKCDFSLTTANWTAESQNFGTAVETKWGLRAYGWGFYLKEAATLKGGIPQPKKWHQSIHGSSSPGGWLPTRAAAQWFPRWWTAVLQEHPSVLPACAASPRWTLARGLGILLGSAALPTHSASAGGCARGKTPVTGWVTQGLFRRGPAVTEITQEGSWHGFGLLLLVQRQSVHTLVTLHVAWVCVRTHWQTGVYVCLYIMVPVFQRVFFMLFFYSLFTQIFKLPADRWFDANVKM